MEIINYFLFGFVGASLGVIPPGLLNMTSAKISVNENRKNALIFSAGVIVIVAIQVWISLLFARFLERNPDIIAMLQLVGLGVFLCMTFYFFFLAGDSSPKDRAKVLKSKKSRFFLGMFLSFINVFPLPYWVFISITFATFGWFDFTKSFIGFCILGAAAGTFFMLWFYAAYFGKLFKKDKKITLNMNYLIGIVTGAISVITLIKIINDNF